MTLPVPSDPAPLLARLRAEERARQADVARLEARLRRFEDVERPAWATWRRLELGPALATLDARRQELCARRVLAERVHALVEDGWHAREALYAVLHPADVAPPVRRDRMDPDEVAARRRAKVARKRAARRAAHQTTSTAATPAAGAAAARARCVVVYRALARRLHPDSPTAIRSLDPPRVKALWAEVHAVYAAGDLARLLSIAAWLDGGAGAEAGDVPRLSLAERYARLRALSRSARTLEARLAELARDPAWDFPSRSERDRRRLRRAAARALEDEIGAVEAALAGIAAFLDAIGSPRRPRARA